MIESRCGLCCTVCSYREPNDCPGCTRQPKPFWGECPVKRCAERRGLAHCGLCPEFPCPTLHDFAYDAEHGTGDGQRLNQCRRWAKMTPRLCACLLVVSDMERATAFYGDLLGLPLVEDAGANRTLACGIALQQKDSWQQLLGRDVSPGPQAGELYFEVEDLEGFAAAAAAYGAEIVQPLHSFPWGQRGLRLHDPDGNLVEVAESIQVVIQRYRAAGLTPEAIARRMAVSQDYIARYLPEEET